VKYRRPRERPAGGNNTCEQRTDRPATPNQPSNPRDETRSTCCAVALVERGTGHATVPYSSGSIGGVVSQTSPDLANRPLIRIRPSARALRDSYRICLPNLCASKSSES
jgi:hypothetical protein